MKKEIHEKHFTDAKDTQYLNNTEESAYKEDMVRCVSGSGSEGEGQVCIWVWL